MTIQEITDLLEREIPLDNDAYAFLRELLPSDRVQIGCELTSRKRRQIERLIRTHFPDWTDDSVEAEVAFRVLTGELTAGLELPESLTPVNS